MPRYSDKELVWTHEGDKLMAHDSDQEVLIVRLTYGGVTFEDSPALRHLLIQARNAGHNDGEFDGQERLRRQFRELLDLKWPPT